MHNERQLADKVALVFGGSKGIGAAIVTKLAADGASVALKTRVIKFDPRRMWSDRSGSGLRRTGRGDAGLLVYRRS